MCVLPWFTRCILASGLSLEDRSTLRWILHEDDQDQEGNTPLVVFTPEIADKRVGDVLTDASMIGLLQVSIVLVVLLFLRCSNFVYRSLSS